MENFPPLQGDQVALLRAKVETGNVLDENYELAINDSQKVYTIFEDVITALLIAQEIIKVDKSIECVIYDKEKTVLHYITVENL
ncbi:hypothetical protein [Chitinophaga sp. RAB17]|uniref:hypothetical protein n=1 Tax=Chitinophaga sp. RAB17 TaxID=3233049 RepID=UPI003F8E0A39